ncbi:MAG: hypothetical protein ABIR81_02200 [Ginsengibacter sp.]
MKKIIFSGLLLFSFNVMIAQDLKKAKNLLDSKQLDKAKNEIDGFTAKNPTNAEGLYVKSKVYGSIATNDQFKALDPNARATAYDAFRQAVDLDKDNKLLLVLTQDQYKPIIDLYSGYYDAGVADFNTAATSQNKADFEKAMSNFIKANEVGRYIYGKKWALSEIDTALVFNIGKAALNADKKDTAAVYFKMLADKGITGTKDGSTGYNLPYQWLALSYKDAKDSTNFLKYAALGKKNFPKDDYFDAITLDYYRAAKNYDALFARYSDVVAAYPDSMTYHFNYANEMFNYVYNSDAGVKIDNREERLKTVGAELEKAYGMKADDVNTNWLYSQYYFNAGIDLKEQANKVKGTKPEDVKAKADFNAQAKTSFEKALPYGEKALTSLEAGFKKEEKSKYKSVADLMQRIYQSLNQADKVKSYQTKYDTADAKFVN